MASLPKRRHSSARQAKRTRALKLHSPTLVKCSHCGEQTLPHTVCAKCGYYKGKSVITIKSKKK